jgi:CBS domain-containing protein
MAKLVRAVMTPDPVTLDGEMSAVQAAEAMKEHDIGDVIVMDGPKLCGIVTDRDLVIRVVASGADPGQVRLASICSTDVAAVASDDSVDTAVQLMRDRDVRRLPVIDNDRPVGIVTMGDLARERDPKSALADVSAAPPNR